MRNVLVFLLLALIVPSCKEVVGPEGLKSLLNIVDEPPGGNCQAGGQKVEVGTDKNRNNQLDVDEVESTKYICNGINGKSSLTKVLVEPKGAYCVFGGLKLLIGTDSNSNGTLEDVEAASTQYICNGNNGTDGKPTLFKIINEAPGTNCISGGYLVQSGIDTNGNNILDVSETQTTQYICNGYTPSSDKQVRIDFQFASILFTDSSNPGLITTIDQGIVRFNKGYYLNVDSIILVSDMWSNVSNNKCYVELYNITDNVTVSGSLIETSSTLPTYISSNDFKNNLPTKEITLGLRIRSESEGKTVGVFKASIIIYKH